jgi:hypothetical protein
MTAPPYDNDGWRPITEATPFDSDLELAVIDGDNVSALVFPCRRSSAGWVKSADKQWLDVRPTHWRPWARS